VGNPEISSLLVSLFVIRFDPVFDRHADRGLLAKQAVADIEGRIDQVESLNEDRVLRSLLRLATATLRTNYYQPHAEDGGIPRLALKLDPRAIPGLPQPRPMFEIFVYSPRVERAPRGGTVARGGLHGRIAGPTLENRTSGSPKRRPSRTPSSCRWAPRAASW
jgi:glutamate dehydrogenase